MKPWILALLTVSQLGSVHAVEHNQSLIKRSMLYQAKKLHRRLSGSYKQWLHSYMTPSVDDVLHHQAVWFDAYADAFIHEQDSTVLVALANKKLWRLFSDLGIKAIHTGPMQLAGGYQAGHYTPSVDGGFDPISLHIDKRYGSDKQFLKLSKSAKKYHSLIISDLIPGHTGKGIDFYLALRGLPDYQGLYTLIDVPKQYWSKLPKVNNSWASLNLTPALVIYLTEEKILPGRLQRVLFSRPEQEVSGWDITGKIKGLDNREHRYVYLHYFKPGQPTLNWLDPSFSAQRLISAHIIHAISILGAKILRIDANPFLGLERMSNSTLANSEGTQLAINASDTIAQLIRKLGGYSFQELNLSIEQLKRFMVNGADFSYDFITRPGIEHAMLTGDARLLNTMLQLLIDEDIDVRRLEHGLQNHDEITYELVEFTENPEKLYRYGNKLIKGQEIRQQVLKSMRDKVSKHSFNSLSNNGLCTTLAALVASRFDMTNPYEPSEQEIAKIKQGMTLILVANAMLPGVLNISGWDLVGALPLTKAQSQRYQLDGDCRWLNRGAYELLTTHQSLSILPRSKQLFLPIDQQLKDKDSFANRFKSIIRFRNKHHLAEAKLIKIYVLGDSVTAFESEFRNQHWFTMINFSHQPQPIPNMKFARTLNGKAIFVDSKLSQAWIQPFDYFVGCISPCTSFQIHIA